jgi:hypothetical protein
MREYRKRKHGTRISAPGSVSSPPSIPRAPEPSGLPRPIIERLGSQRTLLNTGFVRKGGSSFKTALELARTFLFGVLAFRICRYCYNIGIQFARHTVQLLSRR